MSRSGTLCTQRSGLVRVRGWRQNGSRHDHQGFHYETPGTDVLRPRVRHIVGGVLIVVGPSGFPGTREEVERLMPYVILAFATGPALAGPLLTGFISGRAGLREFLSRLLKWRVAGCWYAVALLTAPLLMTAILLALSLFS